jgi:hypothetical protein
MSTDPSQVDPQNIYAYYKDDQYNIHLKNTDLCCFPSVAEVQKTIRQDNNCDDSQNTSSAELCAPPSYPILKQDQVMGHGLECPDGFVMRNDLGLCVPMSEKCSEKYLNDKVCGLGGQYTNDYKQKCGSESCDIRTKKCSISQYASQVHNCMPGKTPYYTQIGKYNDIVDVSEQLTNLLKDQQTKTYQVIDPHYPDYQTLQTVLGTIDKLTTENINNKTLTVNGVLYHVSNITPELNYIEMTLHSQTDLKWYILNVIQA